MSTKPTPNLNLILKRTAKRLGQSEEFVLGEISRIALLIANQVHFGYYAAEDIQQEGIIYGLKVLNKYDFDRPLANFLYIHIRNRVFNLKREKFTRTDPPCLPCHQSVDGHTTHEDGRHCKKYKNWYKINFTKRSLAQPLELEETPTACEDSVGDTAEIKDLLTEIDKVLPVELRSTYLRMRASEPVDEVMQEQVENFIKELIYCETAP